MVYTHIIYSVLFNLMTLFQGDFNKKLIVIYNKSNYILEITGMYQFIGVFFTALKPVSNNNIVVFMHCYLSRQITCHVIIKAKSSKITRNS